MKSMFPPKKSSKKKKIIKYTSFVVLATLGFISYFLLFQYKAEKDQHYSNELIRGEVVATSNDSVTIKGTVTTSDKKYSEIKTIKFGIDSSTVLNKVTFVTPPDQVSIANSGKVFHQTAQKESGAVSDFTIGMVVGKVTAKENLFARSNALIDEINYIKDETSQVTPK